MLIPIDIHIFFGSNIWSFMGLLLIFNSLLTGKSEGKIFTQPLL